MHLFMVILVLGCAWGLRCCWFPKAETWSDRWQSALVNFLLPPVLLLTTAVALLCMGPQGQMVQWWEGWGSYVGAIGFLLSALLLGGKLALEAGRSLCRVRQYASIQVHGRVGRLIESPIPFIAQVGFWQPELVISQGLLESLDRSHLDAVLVHEQAHYDYRDTFWFFWLGWLRRLTAWLPNTELLWQELLMLRELRADQRAAQQVDGLLLAEALLTVVSAPLTGTESIYAGFGAAVERDRLSERIEALLAPPTLERPAEIRYWLWLLAGILPLLVIPLHS